MPEGIHKDMSEQDLVDLVEYLELLRIVVQGVNGEIAAHRVFRQCAVDIVPE